MPTLEQATARRLSEIRDLARSGVTELTGRAIRERGHEGAFVSRIGGLKPAFPELLTLSDSPKQIAAAIDRGEGKVFRRVYATVERAMEREGFQPQRKRTAGRPTVPPHEGRPYCHVCREWHAKGQHRSHGTGSFHRTHLWGFSLGNPAPMTKDTARQVFAELMKKARNGHLTEKERAQLRTASQIIRYEKRRGFTGSINPRQVKGKTKTYCPVCRSYWMDSLKKCPQCGRKLMRIILKKNPRGFTGRVNKPRGGMPKAVRQELRFASDAINAWLRGMSIPQVALRYRYEPIQGMVMIRTAIQDYGLAAVSPWVPKHILSVVQSKSNPKRRRNPAGRRTARGRRGLIRMGKLVELRYQRDHGQKRGFYKHVFKSAPTLYYDATRNTILAR